MNTLKTLISTLARMTLYDTKCATCGRDAATPNPECDEHAAFVPSDPDDDAERTLNEMITLARQVQGMADSLFSHDERIITFHSRRPRGGVGTASLILNREAVPVLPAAGKECDTFRNETDVRSGFSANHDGPCAPDDE